MADQETANTNDDRRWEVGDVIATAKQGNLKVTGVSYTEEDGVRSHTYLVRHVDDVQLEEAAAKEKQAIENPEEPEVR